AGALRLDPGRPGLGPRLLLLVQHEHRPPGLGLLTPPRPPLLLGRASSGGPGHRAAADAAHPERFPNGLPQPPARPGEVWISPPRTTRPLLSLAKTPPVGQVVDLSALVGRESELDDHPPAPPAATSPLSLRQPPAARPRERRPAPATRGAQEDSQAGQAAAARSTLRGRSVQNVDRVAGRPPHGGRARAAPVAAAAH